MPPAQVPLPYTSGTTNVSRPYTCFHCILKRKQKKIISRKKKVQSHSKRKIDVPLEQEMDNDDDRMMMTMMMTKKMMTTSETMMTVPYHGGGRMK